MKFVDSVGTELNEDDEVIVPYNNTFAMGRVAKLSTGMGLDQTQSMPSAVIAAMITPLVTPRGQVLNIISVKSIQQQAVIT